MNETTSAFLNWKPVAGRLLQSAINRVIALDPQTKQRVLKLDRRSIVLRLINPELAMQLDAEQGEIRVGKVQEEKEADLGIRATISGVFAQLPGLRGELKTSPGQVRIEGDAELARELQQIAEQFDPDIDKGFAETFGAVLGPQIAKHLKKALRDAQVVATRFAQEAVDYAVEEQRDVLGKAELNAFYDDVDQVRDAVERAGARLKRLQERSA
jgi:ubiquinone biosynthesis accessory factor UbiJ